MYGQQLIDDKSMSKDVAVLYNNVLTVKYARFEVWGFHDSKYGDYVFWSLPDHTISHPRRLINSKLYLNISVNNGKILRTYIHNTQKFIPLKLNTKWHKETLGKYSVHKNTCTHTSIFKVKVTLRLTVSQSVCLGVVPLLGYMTSNLSHRYLCFRFLKYFGMISRFNVKSSFNVTFKVTKSYFILLNHINPATTYWKPDSVPNLEGPVQSCYIPINHHFK
jgi:hypothetical protein